MIEVTSSLVLDYCWICHGRNTKMNEHHLVPRAFGGADGPTVTLCSSDHNCIHDAALACYPHEFSPKANKWLQQLPSIPLAHDKFMYLVNVIVRSRKMASTQANKARHVGAKLSAKDAYMFDRLSHELSLGSKPLTHEQVILHAIRHLYSSMGLR